MTNSLTVGEIAERIREPDEDLAAVIDRLRNWTKEGLLKPIRKKTGIGRKRRYQEEAIVTAAILSRLSRYYGNRATELRSTGAVDIAIEELSKAKSIPEWKDAYLLVGTVKQKEAWQITAEVRYVDTDRSSPTSDRKLDRVDLSTFDDGFFINLSKMFKRLGVPLKEAADEEAFLKAFPGASRIKQG